MGWIMTVFKKLNLGCGFSRMPPVDGWVNIDIDVRFNPDIVRDLSRGLPFENGTCDKVLASHIIEHFVPADVIFLIQECQRVLVPGGILMITVPLGVAPDLTHESFFHEFTFDNLLVQKYNWSLSKLILISKVFVDVPAPENYRMMTVTFEKVK